ncbi:hypothetical protein Tsubulata_021257 [Turnera subulata]|uniref:Small ribosomal subunit protein bS18c n=1 Tax=Turnera subulata TaxID=218843 RepID=A0A9Q0FA98_9ROSI|nr:hypothetical protein Tsubulata_021257 [Turnera subulata]
MTRTLKPNPSIRSKSLFFLTLSLVTLLANSTNPPPGLISPSAAPFPPPPSPSRGQADAGRRSRAPSSPHAAVFFGFADHYESTEMRIVSRRVLWSVNNCLSRQSQAPALARALSSRPAFGIQTGPWQSHDGSSESVDQFERRIFGESSRTGSNSDSFFQKLDRLQKSRRTNLMSDGEEMDELDESFNTLSDGMDGELKKAATFFEVDEEELGSEGYTFRPDMSFEPGGTYETRDLDLTKPGVYKPPIRDDLNVTTEEVLAKADFRNVAFLANFITEAGIIIKRSKTGISAKAQRKIAREIKTARAFGLMPFTTMGTKSFAFGVNMENQDADYQYEIANADYVDEEEPH